MSQEDHKTPADRLAEWQALDERVRAAVSGYGVSTREQIAGM